MPIGIYVRTEEHKRKIGLANSIALKGKHFPHSFKKGCIPWCKGTKGICKSNSGSFKKGHENIGPKKGQYKRSLETRILLSVVKSGTTLDRKGYRHSIKTRRKMSLADKGRKPWNKGMKGVFVKEKSMNWQGGLSLEEYGYGFDSSLKEQIRFRDGYKCRLCGCSQIENGKQLDVHHIDSNKCNNSTYNLISLCVICHRKVGGKNNRVKWEHQLLSIF
jgi:hypothetical protein